MNSLQALTDDELVHGLRALEARGRATVAEILAHLVEMSRRRLHLRLGYSSLYEYCRSALGLSEDEAYRRMTAAQVAEALPEVLGLVRDGQITLTTLTMLKRHLRYDNAEELLQLASGQSKRQLERVLAARFPECARDDVLARGRARPTGAASWRLEVEIDETTWALLERALDLLSHVNPERRLGPVLQRALGGLVEQLEKQRRAKRSSGAQGSAAQGAHIPSDTPPSDAPPSRAGARPTIPRPMKRAIFERDGERCTFVGRDGRRCEGTWQLELDHRVPWALSREHSATDLRVLCRAHNRLLAEEWFGRQACVGRKMASRGVRKAG
jgi:hypothetical protein